ncbi:hypothetical protein FRZ61_43800 [Hypericibacter adhaerens]|uniref:Uncharacterized protein n=1 Tax=Hypericibacter adhaerens TaxID=2602016 RepID=A0A5J6N3Q3_9PROT|nr:hypothetical protein FRZ61_43800 [Hypericibacter adhaerens]
MRRAIAPEAARAVAIAAGRYEHAGKRRGMRSMSAPAASTAPRIRVSIALTGGSAEPAKASARLLRNSRIAAPSSAAGLRTGPDILVPPPPSVLDLGCRSRIGIENQAVEMMKRVLRFA